MNIKKTIKNLLLTLCAMLVTLVAVIYVVARSQGLFRSPEYDQKAPVISEELRHPAVLVFKKTNGFIHKEAIPVVDDLLGRISNSQGGSVFVTDNAAVHNPKDLARFDAIVWNNVSGDVLTLEQREALRGYLEAGGGFVGIHGAGGDSSYDWKWYPAELIKAQFKGHPMFPQFQSAVVNVENSTSELTAHLPKSFTLTDEWYSFEKAPEGVNVLLSVDEGSYSPKIFSAYIGMGDKHPIAWSHCVGQGRVLYTAIGHLPEVYQDPNYKQFLDKSIAWAAASKREGCR